MKVVRISPKGQITLPAKILQQLELEDGGLLQLQVTSEGLVLKSLNVGDDRIEMYTDDRIEEFLKSA